MQDDDMITLAEGIVVPRKAITKLDGPKKGEFILSAYMVDGAVVNIKDPHQAQNVFSQWHGIGEGEPLC